MVLALTPILEGLEAARRAAADAIGRNDEVMVDDQGDHWVFEFISRDDTLGGGARVLVAKSNLSVLKLVRGQ